jgi:hypothetical protein
MFARIATNRPAVDLCSRKGDSEPVGNEIWARTSLQWSACPYTSVRGTRGSLLLTEELTTASTKHMIDAFASRDDDHSSEFVVLVASILCSFTTGCVKFVDVFALVLNRPT